MGQMGRQRAEPGPGQESVWDYPRPPRLEDSERRFKVVFGGVTLAYTTRAKRVLENELSNPHIDELYETACKHGALGGKITGAGGGGYMFFYWDSKRKHIVAEQLERLGAQVVEFDFNFGGLQTWEVR